MFHKSEHSTRMFPSIYSGVENIRQAVTAIRRSLDTSLREMAREIFTV